MQNQTNPKHSSNPEGNYKSAKNFLEKLNSNKDSSKTTISNVLNKIPNRKKTSKQQYNFCKVIKVHGMLWEAKFLKE